MSNEFRADIDEQFNRLVGKRKVEMERRQLSIQLKELTKHMHSVADLLGSVVAKVAVNAEQTDPEQNLPVRVCGQCGMPIESSACGPTHALLQQKDRTPITIGSALRILRERLGETLGQTAAFLGLSVTELSDMERNRAPCAICSEKKPDAVELKRLREELSSLKSYFALHPYGSCTCQGEGNCGWCIRSKALEDACGVPKRSSTTTTTTTPGGK